MWVGFLLALMVIVLAGLPLPHEAVASSATIVAEGRYLMADGDTLAVAEEKVLQRAKRSAVEEAGTYLESTFHDVEKTTDDGSVQVSSLEIRTIAAAITKTEILESRRSFENDRPSFYVRIRAVVDLDNLQDTIRRWQSERQLAEHFRRLQKENAELKAQLHNLKTAPTGVRTLTIEPAGRNGARAEARAFVERAIATRNFGQKLDLASQAAALDPQSVDPLIVRGQTYLQLVSAAYSNRSKLSEYSEYVDNARMDFDRALMIDPKNTWALLGQGDVHTWLQRPDEAAQSYEQALALDPFFDVAHHRLITLHTTQARKLTATKQWPAALAVLQKLLDPHLPDSWIPYHKEAYLLRSEIYKKLNQPTLAIDDLSVVLRVEPTDPHTLLARARLYQEQLQGRLAKDDFERACALGSAEACEQLP
ncbi:MAG: tetratricopeptide repeat protein [Nitrospiraceae bacterium]